jgi:membrane protein YdbS with pleckstrin-like domain
MQLGPQLVGTDVIGHPHCACGATMWLVSVEPADWPGSDVPYQLAAVRGDVMSYVQRVLQPGEQVRHISSTHWILYWPGVGFALMAVIAWWLSETMRLTGFWRYTAYALAVVAVVLLVQQWFQWWVTEIAVTNRRVIYKKGLVRRQTNEMNMDKVESVQIDQSILGRMLDFGNVTILGTGEGFETLHTIASPMELRNSITATPHNA